MQIHVARGEQQLGVFSPEEVRARLNSGQFLPTDYGWAEGQAQWTPLSLFPGLPAVAVAAGTQLAYAAAASVVAGRPATSSAAVASLICGILGMILLPVVASLPAVICGHIARSNIKQSNGSLTGAGMAMVGLVMGYLILSVFAMGIVAGFALPVFGSVQARGLEVKALANAKSIAVACRLYAVDHGGKYPDTLEELVPDFVPDRAIFVCPFDKAGDPMGYEYYGAGTKDSDSDPEKVFLVSKVMSRAKGRVVVYADSSGKVVKNVRELPPH